MNKVSIKIQSLFPEKGRGFGDGLGQVQSVKTNVALKATVRCCSAYDVYGCDLDGRAGEVFDSFSPIGELTDIVHEGSTIGDEVIGSRRSHVLHEGGEERLVEAAFSVGVHDLDNHVRKVAFAAVRKYSGAEHHLEFLREAKKTAWFPVARKLRRHGKVGKVTNLGKEVALSDARIDKILHNFREFKSE